MKKFVLILMPLLVFSLTGCRAQRPDLKVDTSAEKVLDGGHPVIVPNEVNAAQTERDLGGNVKVVTAEPAITDEEKEGDVSTAEDKTGAVAVKMEY